MTARWWRPSAAELRQGKLAMVKRAPKAPRLLLPLLALAVPLCSGGCGSSKTAGGPEAAEVGGLLGPAEGGPQNAMHAAAVGSGVGYVIGDKEDEAKAKEMTAKGKTAEVAPLGGSRWTLVTLNTRMSVAPYVSKVIEFRPDAHVITTTTRPDGSVVVFDEAYRVVGTTLIVNKPGYLINARYRFEGDRMILVANTRYRNDGERLVLDDPGFSAVLQRKPASPA
jgi:hypothetical protein